MVASLVVDDPDICNLLLSRLNSNDKFACEVYVDEDTYTKMREKYPHQRPRLLLPLSPARGQPRRQPVGQLSCLEADQGSGTDGQIYRDHNQDVGSDNQLD